MKLMIRLAVMLKAIFQGARPRDKFRTKTDESVRFGGLGFISIPNIKSEHFANVNAAFNVKLKVS